jgi:hypothetical protein
MIKAVNMMKTLPDAASTAETTDGLATTALHVKTADTSMSLLMSIKKTKSRNLRMLKTKSMDLWMLRN